MIPTLALKIAAIDRIEDRLKAKPTAHVSSATALHKWMETGSAGSFSDADEGSDGRTMPYSSSGERPSHYGSVSEDRR